MKVPPHCTMCKEPQPLYSMYYTTIDGKDCPVCSSCKNLRRPKAVAKRHCAQCNVVADQMYFKATGDELREVCSECIGLRLVEFCAVCGTPKEPSRLFPKIVNGEEKRVCLSCGLLDTRPIEDRITALEAKQNVIVESQTDLARIMYGLVQLSREGLEVGTHRDIVGWEGIDVVDRLKDMMGE